MYQDTKRIRSKVTVYLDQYEADLINAYANICGLSKAETMRQMMMKEARELLGGDPVTLTNSVDAQVG